MVKEEAIGLLKSIPSKLFVSDVGMSCQIQTMTTNIQNAGINIKNVTVTNDFNASCANNGTKTDSAFCNVAALQDFWHPLFVTDFCYSSFISSDQTFLLYQFPPLFIIQAIIKKPLNFKNGNRLTQFTPVPKDFFLGTI